MVTINNKHFFDGIHFEKANGPKKFPYSVLIITILPKKKCNKNVRKC